MPKARLELLESPEGHLWMKEAMCFGVGAHIFRLLKTAEGKNVEKVAVYDPDVEKVARWWRRNKMRAARSFVDFKIYSGLGGFRTGVIGGLAAYHRGCAIIWPPTEEKYPEEFAKWDAIVTEATARRAVHGNTARSRSLNFTESILRNMRALPDCWDPTTFKTPLKGKPAFIVSAGPSLDKNQHLLIAARTRGPLFVVNTAAKACRASGIDVLMTIENMDVTDHYRDVLDVVDWTSPAIIANEAAFAAPGRKCPHFTPGDPAIRLANELGVPPFLSGPTVAASAFGFAWRLGANPIILVGQDCALTDGKFHGTDTHYKGHAAPKGGGNLMVPAWGSTEDEPVEVETRQDLLQFGRWFESMSTGIPGEQRRLINATEGGMQLAGWEEMPLADVIAELPEWERGPDWLSGEKYDAEKIEEARVRMLEAVQSAEKQCVQFILNHDEYGIEEAAQCLQDVKAENGWIDAHATKAFHAILTAPGVDPVERLRMSVFAMLRSAKTLEAILQ